MIIKQGILKCINEKIDSLYLASCLHSLLGFFYNIKLCFFAKKISKIDSIMEYEKFTKLVSKYKININKYTFREMSCSSYFYGYYKSLCEYAGFPYKKTRYIYLEHGIDSKPSNVDQNNCFANIFQGDYCKNDIKSDKHIIYFSIGPYIKYAKSYYHKENIDIIKKENGNTALIYITHSCANCEIDIKEDTYVKLVESIRQKYKTILVCVYWRDINNPLLNQLKHYENVHFVSAGFINDENFVSRSKTILELADDVYVDGFGTNIGYAIYMNKNVCISIDSYDASELDCKIIKFIKASKNNQKEMMKQYHLLWGGEEKIKSKREMYLFFEGCKEIFDQAKGRKSLYDKAILEKLEYWKNTKNEKYELFNKIVI